MLLGTAPARLAASAIYFHRRGEMLAEASADVVEQSVNQTAGCLRGRRLEQDDDGAAASGVALRLAIRKYTIPT